MTRTYSVRTYGCQMNEHDSERIAGLLEADGLVPAASEDQADVVVLNTCCIRENADNRLYGALGHLKAAKEARPGLQVQWPAVWPRRIGISSKKGPATSMWCLAPTMFIGLPNS